MPKMRRSVRRKLPRSSRKMMRRRRKQTLQTLDLSVETRKQISGFVQLALAAVTFLVIQGKAGIMGEGVFNVLTFFFGQASMLLPIALTLSGVFLLLKRDGHFEFRSAVGLSLCLVAAIGFMVSFPLLACTRLPVSYVVLSALLLVGMLITFESNPVSLIRKLHAFMHPKGEEEETVKASGRSRSTKPAAGSILDVIEKGMKKGEEEEERGKSKEERRRRQKEEEAGVNIVRPAFVQEDAGKKDAKRPAGADKKTAMRNNEEDELGMQDTRFENWEFPPLDCLEDARSVVMVDDETLKKQAALIEEKLKEVDVAVTVREAHPGPTVTQFALEPSEGVKLSRIANLKNDLALALAAPSLRIEAPIPGKSLVGIEMPNIKRTTVHLREILESPEFRESESSLSLPFGRDVSGKAVVYDLADMPHLLIAGATGSGKSGCMNTVLISLLYHNAPHELKFILIDPKRVELSLYDGIPHLLTPV